MPRRKRLSYSLYECKDHIVFCPKYRHRAFREKLACYMREAMLDWCARKDDSEVLELNVQPDHTHLVLSIAPKYAVSEVMGYLKEKLALRLFCQSEALGKRFWGRQFWARGTASARLVWTKPKSAVTSNTKNSGRNRLS